MSSRGCLLVYSPLNEPRRYQLSRLNQLQPSLFLITEGINQEDIPVWAKHLFRYVLPLTRMDTAASIQKLQTFINAERIDVSGIITLSETGVYFCACVADELELNYLKPEQVEGLRNKYSMRDVFARAGLPTVDYGSASDVNEARAVSRRIGGYPVVIKPPMAGGSLYIQRINDDRQMEAAFDICCGAGCDIVSADPLVSSVVARHKGPFLLVEKLIEGETQFATRFDLPVGEVSIEGCVINGVMHVLGFHDKPLPDNGPYFEEVFWSSPTRIPDALQKQLIQLAQSVVECTGLNNQMFHLEARTTPQGPILLEIAARMGGGPIARSVMCSTGIDLVEIMFCIATNKPVTEDQWRARYHKPTITLGLFAQEGLLTAISGLDAVKAHPQVVEISVYEKPGTYIYRAPQSDHCTLHVMICGDSFDEVEAIGKWVESTITFHVDQSTITDKARAL